MPDSEPPTTPVSLTEREILSLLECTVQFKMILQPLRAKLKTALEQFPHDRRPTDALDG